MLGEDEGANPAHVRGREAVAGGADLGAADPGNLDVDAASEELEDLRWHPVGDTLAESFRDVTRFMLARAIALRTGTDNGAAPLFYWAKNARRIGVCREGAASFADEKRG